MNDLLQDIRFGLRMLRRNPGFTFIAVAVLALGIGATTAMFSAVDAVLMRPLPYHEPDRLVWVWEKTPDGGSNNVADANFLDWRDQNTVFDGICATAGGRFILTGIEQPEQISGARVSADFFDLLGVQPTLGRTFHPDEEVPGRDKVVVLSHGLWQRRFGADLELVGKSITLNGEKVNIIGVMPPDFQFRNPDHQMWTPLAFDRAEVVRDMHYLQVIARLKPEVGFDQALAEMETITAQMIRHYPERKKDWSATIQPLHDRLVRPELRDGLLVLFGAVGFLLLTACVNVSNLLLARSVSRRKEIAVRCSLGAGRLRLVRQLLTECVLLAAMGSALAVAMTNGFIRAFPSIFPAVSLPAAVTLDVDARVLLFSLATALAASVFFGLAPAWQASHSNPSDALREGGRTGTGGGVTGRRFRHALVVIEVALALVLLIGAGLMMKSLDQLQKVDPGVRIRNVLTMDLSLPATKYPDAGSIIPFFREALGRIEALPGVRSAGICTTLPLQGSRLAMPIEVEGSTYSGPVPNVQRVSPGYFAAVGIELVEGRLLTDDDHEMSLRVAVVNERFVERYFGDGTALQKTFEMLQLRTRKRELGPYETWRIVGVIKNVKTSGLLDDRTAEIYVPYQQSVPTSAALAVRTEIEAESMANAVRETILSVDGDQPATQVATMDEILAQSVSQPELRSHLLGLFASLALILAALGIYGVTAYSVSERRHEIGIRVSLGAQRGDIFRIILRQAFWTTALGIGIGAVAARGLTQLISNLLFGVTPTDPLTFGGVTAVLTVVASLASTIPARRAARVDPIEALRGE
jgi:putative ABC transport system permease protein